MNLRPFMGILGVVLIENVVDVAGGRDFLKILFDRNSHFRPYVEYQDGKFCRSRGHRQGRMQAHFPHRFDACPPDNYFATCLQRQHLG